MSYLQQKLNNDKQQNITRWTIDNDLILLEIFTNCHNIEI